MKTVIQSFGLWLLVVGAVQANCWLMCEPQQLESAGVLAPNLDDGYPLRLCLNKPLGRRDRLHPLIVLRNDKEQTLSSEFVLSRFSGEAKDDQCYTRDLLANITDLSAEDIAHWMIDFAPERLVGITITMRDKTMLSGDYISYQVYDGH